MVSELCVSNNAILESALIEDVPRFAVVLFENDVEGGMMHGFTENYIRVMAKYDPVLVNDVKKIRLKSIHESGLAEIEEVSTDVFVH